MKPSDDFTVLLFSYGTLQDPTVQMANFGRLLLGRNDEMLGYSMSYVEITDPEVLATSGKSHHPIVAPDVSPDARVAGRVFQVSERELAAADAYEVSDYRRVAVQLLSGQTAWVYVQA